MIRRLVLASVIVSLAFPFASVAPTSAAVDTWRVLHVGLESFPASDDTDGDGRVNTWGGRNGNLKRSNFYEAWRTDVACFEGTVEAWSGWQINVQQDRVVIDTDQWVENNPYSFMGSGLAAAYGFESYDVIMVWSAYTQALGFDGGTWNGDALGTGYSYIALYGLYGAGCPNKAGTSGWPAYVPAHEFVHTVTGLYAGLGYPVCGTYEYNYWQFGEWDGHKRILTNTFPATTCSSGVVSTGVPPAAFASGSWMDHY
jgi:hypothetical protein